MGGTRLLERFATAFSEIRCGPLDEVPPHKLSEEMDALTAFMPPTAPHDPALDALWNAYLRYGQSVWALLEAYGGANGRAADSPWYDGLRAAAFGMIIPAATWMLADWMPEGQYLPL